MAVVHATNFPRISGNMIVRGRVSVTFARNSLLMSSRKEIFLLALIPVFVPVAIMLVLIGLLFEELHRAELEVQNQVHSKFIVSQANTLSKLFYDAGVALGGSSISKNPLFVSRFEVIRRQIPMDMKEMKTRSKWSPLEKRRVDQIEKIVDSGLQELDHAKANLSGAKVGVAQFQLRQAYKRIRGTTDEIDSVLKQINANDARAMEAIARDESGKGENATKTAWTFIVSAFVIGLLLMTAFSVHVSRYSGISAASVSIFCRGLAPLVVPLVMLSAVAFVILELQVRAHAEVKQQMHEKAIIARANTLSKVYYDAGVAIGAYSITLSPFQADRLRKLIDALPVELSQLKSLVEGNKGQTKILAEAEAICGQGVAIFKAIKRVIDDSIESTPQTDHSLAGFSPAPYHPKASDRAIVRGLEVAQFRTQKLFKLNRELTVTLQDKLRDLTDEERKIEGRSPLQLNRSRTILKLCVFGGTAGAVLVAGVLLFILSTAITKNSSRKDESPV